MKNTKLNKVTHYRCRKCLKEWATSIIYGPQPSDDKCPGCGASGIRLRNIGGEAA